MKRLCGFLLILFFGLILVGCHKHSFKAEVTNPTCSEQGYTTYTCSCGKDTYVDNYVNALGHSYSDWKVVKEATEEETGLKEKVCSRCSDKQTEIIPELTHTHKYTDSIINPTCVDKGYTLHTCKCGDSYKDNFTDALGHTEVILPKVNATCTTSGLTEGKKCSVCEEILVKQTEIKALGHSYSEWKVVKEATEETTGLKEKVCSRCSDKQTEIIPELTHTHKYTDSIINPTCVDKGYTLHTCKCGDSYKDNYVDAKGHTEVILPKVDATCVEAGLTEGKKCSVCETILVKQEVIKAKGHTEVILPKVDATCTEAGLIEGKKCSVCEEVLVKQEVIKAKGHTETDWIIDSETTCTENGSKHKECSICKKVLEIETIYTTGHNYKKLTSNPTCTTQGYTLYTCTKCNYTYNDNFTDALGHTEVILQKVDATCTETGLTEGKKCSVCEEILVKQEETKALGHSYSEWKVVKEATEEEAGLKEKVCSRCSDKQTEIIPELSHTHKYTDSIINPTCVDKGYILHTCKCGDSYKDNYTNELGHNYGEVSYVWSNDYKTVTATRICQNDNNHIETEIVNTTQTITQNKTCLLDELSTFKAEFKNSAFIIQVKENIKTNEKINHINKAHHEKIEPKCEEQGTIEYWSCPDCNKFFSDEQCITEVTDLSIKELGHTEVILPKVEATCTEDGLTIGKKCSVCNTILVKQEEIKAKGHEETNWIIDSETTCINNGSKHKECSICKKVLEIETIYTTGHNYKKLTSNPTCTTQGYTLYTCTKCNYTYKDNFTDALGHTEVILTRVDATCTDTGLTEGKKCSVCEEVLAKQNEIEALGHSYSEWKVVKEATEETTGLKEKVCSRCSDKQTEIIPELTHTHKYIDSIINPTCVDKGYTLHTCKCGDSYKDNYTNALGHTEVILPKVDATCTETGLTEGKKCSVCETILVKQEEIKANGHNYGEVSYVWSNDYKTVTATRICQNDNNHIETEIVNTTQTITQNKTCLLDELSTFKAVFTNQAFLIQTKENIKTSKKINHINKVYHEKINATCTTNGTIEYWNCPDCGKFFSDETCLIEVANTIINKLDHIETDWIIDTNATCTENGSKHKECSICKETLKMEIIYTAGHDYKETIINPTCTTQGYTLYTCTKCNDSYKDNYTNVLEHDFSNQGNIVLLNDNKKAVKRYNCLNCTNYKDEVYTGYYLDNNNAYYFNDLGNREDINESFINYNGNTYYIINNIIVKNYYIIDGTIYDFGTDGIKKDILLNEEIVEVNNNKYYVLNNIIQVNTYILYNQHMYYFDNNGCALVNTTYNNHNYGSNGYLVGNDILIEIDNILYDVNNDIVTLHNHKINHIEYKAKTCTVDGNKEYYYCTKCDKYYLDNAYTNEVSKEEVIIKASHNLTHYEEKQPTCTEEGYKAYDKCNDCTFSTFESISIINCILSDWIIDTDATCTEKGSKHKECTMCKKILETEDIKAKGHNYVDGKCNECGSIKDVLEFVNGYVYFGEYPQTLKEDSVTITSSTQDSDGYYLGSDGERYVKVEAKPWDSSYVFNDETTSIVEGNTYYFKVEPIKWKIEEESDGVYKLVSTIILDNQMYHSSSSERTIDGEIIYSNNYEYSDIRKWLNNDFLNKAFTEQQQTYIITTKVDNSLSSTTDSSNPYICNNTLDKIYLPSVEEMTNTSYGYNSNQYIYDTTRCKQLTDYAKALGCYMNDSSSYYNNGFYWLRSPKYMLNNSACLVGDSGYINYSSSVNNSKACVAPALTINLNSKCEEHQESDWIVYNEATCTTKGLKYKECSVCKEIYDVEVIPAKGHTESNWIIDIDATCTEKGNKHKECTVCNKVVETEEIKANGHNYIDRKCSVCGSIKDVLEFVNGYIYFGEYPQSLKEDSVTITSSTPDSDGYYMGSDGERYVKVKANPYSSSYVFNNETTSIVEGRLYYFKVEPIKWKIESESNGTYKLISTIILDNQKWYSSWYEERTIDGQTIYANNYEYSDIRKWLNNDFLNKAFTEEEQTYINTTIVDNGLSSTGDSINPYICNNTLDKIYLPSYEEMTNTSYGYNSSSTRQKQLTDYAKALGCYMETDSYYYNNGYYWLRSPYDISSSGVRNVSSYGDIYNYSVSNTIVGVAPALTINLNSKCEEHLQSDWIIFNDATCITKGLKYKECTKCKEVLETKQENCLGHDWNDGKIETESTCTTKGSKIFTCKRCNVTKEEKLELLEHIESDWKVEFLSTCSTTGQRYKECTMCSKLLETEEIATYEHNYVNGKCSVCGSIKDVLDFVNDYIYFGEYPQTLKEDSVTITSTTPDSDGYYMGSDGERYAKVEAKPNSSSYVFNDKLTSIVEGRMYYFKVEPIKWKIESESNGIYKLISTIILDNQMYYSSTSTSTIDGNTIYANNYEYSDIRKWLNDDFLNKAFDEQQQTYINTSEVDNSLSSTGDETNPYICNNTLDKIYLPSYKEMTNTSYGYTSSSSRRKQLTDYAKALGCYMNTGSSYYNNGNCWLRSPYDYYSYYVRYVYSSGRIYSSNVSITSVGVAPALTINLNSKCEEHLQSDWIIFNEATCTTKGLKYKECSVCKEIYDVEVIPAKGHTESNWIIDIDATCTEKGNKHKECIACNKVVETEEIELKEHNYIDGKCSLCGSIKDVLEFVNGYIYFGEYPQSLKEDSVTITSTTPDSDGYYMGSDGERYAKVEAKPYNSSYVFNDKTTSIVEGRLYYFKVEPIKWKIESESNGIYKLISTIILDKQKFYSSTSTRTIDGQTIYANNYEYSDIRKWLNDDFLNKAFTEEAQTYINTTIVNNGLSSTGDSINPYICNNILDKIYLPSEEEITNSSSYNAYDAARYKQLTDYAKALGCCMGTDSYYNNGDYWLRSPSNRSSSNARLVDYCGYFNDSGINTVLVSYFGVVPALTINLNSKCEEHQESDWIIFNESTCTTKSLKYKECTKCKEVLETKQENCLGHDWDDGKIEIESTCTTKGSKIFTCKRCNVTKEEKLELLEHIESDWKVEFLPTCSTTGQRYKECTVCNKIVETEEIELKEHNYIDGKCSVCGSIKDVLEFVNGYIYFGEYPQSLKEDSVTITSSTPDSDGYYMGSDGERYVKVKANPYNSSYVFNDKLTTIVNEATYYFKVEPIKWKIEEESNGTYKLISTIILDNQKWYSSWYEERTIDGQTIYANNYEYSDIRKWLNDDFYNKAFTEQQQAYINITIVDNGLSSTGDESNPYICNNTLDKIYLPSVEEMTNTSYGYDSNQYYGGTARQKQLTDYAKALGCYVYIDYNTGFYWLRSPYDNNSYYVRYVNNNGYFSNYYVFLTYVGVAPALSITIK